MSTPLLQFDLGAISGRRGATVHFDIRHVSGGRTGAVASRRINRGAYVEGRRGAEKGPVYISSLPPNMAPDRESLQEETDLPGTIPQVPC